jgi:predicted DNA-binding protein
MAKTATLIRFTDEQHVKLSALSLQSGHSVAALVRWCVEKSLPALAGNIEQQVNESTIDTSSKA